MKEKACVTMVKQGFYNFLMTPSESGEKSFRNQSAHSFDASESMFPRIRRPQKFIKPLLWYSDVTVIKMDLY